MYGDTTQNGTAIPSEELYKTVYKRLMAFLYDQNDFPFTFFFPGLLLEWFQKNHKEILSILGELIDKKQIEILGGGFYNPQFPLLLPVDRLGQIELLTTQIRKIFGKRPRGCFLNESVWDSSFVTSLKSSGLEYVLLDSGILQQNQEDSVFKVSITEDLGKSVFILPENSKLVHENISASGFLELIQEKTKNISSNSVVCCFFAPEKMKELLETNWFLDVKNLIIQDKLSIELTLPSKAIKAEDDFCKVVVPSCMSKNASDWAFNAFSKCDSEKQNMRATIRKFMLLYPEILNLYSKMSYVTLLINQCRGDKSRKKSAQESLWKAQNGSAYWHIEKSGFTDTKFRHEMYTNLIQAEKFVRDSGKFIESISAFDMNNDGLKEYVAQFLLYNAYVSRKGGMIFEFDVLHCQKNYTDTICKNIQRKLFTDYLISDDDFNILVNKKALEGDVCFGNKNYRELKFDRIKKEVKFEVQSLFNNKNAVKLVKEYHFTKDSIRVDYRLVNISKENVCAWFVVENSLCMSECDAEYLTLEASDDDVLMPFMPDDDFYSENGIFTLRMNDTLSGSCFTLSSSDPATMYVYPTFFESQYVSTVSGLAWKINLLPGAVISRTLTLYLKTTKKAHKK